MRSFATLAILTLTDTAVHSQTFTIDDKPFAPLVGPVGLIPGCGPEDQFALAPAFCPPGVAPSPSLNAALTPLGSGSILGPGPNLVLAGPNGCGCQELGFRGNLT